MKEKQNFAANAQDCMAYLPGMEVIESDILREVQCAADRVDFNAFTERDIKAALMRKPQNGTGFCGASFAGRAAVFGRNGAAGKAAYF